MRTRSIAAIFMVMAGMIGCAPTKIETTAPVAPEPRYLTHEVRFRGETLGLIANWYTGSTGNWQVIKDANPRMNELNIQIGDRIDIPEEIVLRTSPLPQNVVYSARSAASTQEETVALDDLPDGESEATEQALADAPAPAAVEENGQPEVTGFGIASFFRRAGQMNQAKPQATPLTGQASESDKALPPAPTAEETLNAALAGGHDASAPSVDETLHKAVEAAEQQAHTARQKAADVLRNTPKATPADPSAEDAVKSREEYLAEMLKEGQDAE